MSTSNVEYIGQSGGGLPLSGGQMTGDILMVTNDYDKPSVRIGPYETGVSVWGNTKVVGVAGFSSSTTQGAMLKSTLPLSWSTAYINGAADLMLYRGGSGILSQRNGANAQEFDLFGTWTSASIYERLAFRTSAGDYTIAAEAAGGGTQRNLLLDGANRSAYVAAPTTTEIRDLFIAFGLMSAS